MVAQVLFTSISHVVVGSIPTDRALVLISVQYFHIIWNRLFTPKKIKKKNYHIYSLIKKTKNKKF